MARDRKRAKQRRDRRVREGAPTATPNQPGRAEVPGALDHASADVDEFDAALVRGADGVPAPAAEEPDAGAEDALQEHVAAPAGGGSGAGGTGGDGHALAERPSGAPLRGGNRVTGFLRASWAELQRVQWPDRRQVTQATAVVLGFVAIAGLYLGLADFVAKEIVEFIL
ncbi:MAG: preprotein translocase subunit SecE [Solirubrobacteraceae bacterium]|nr:preprotein translocase subunit SecE [Solirubrobacteraceae bacterium]